MGTTNSMAEQVEQQVSSTHYTCDDGSKNNKNLWSTRLMNDSINDYVSSTDSTCHGIDGEMDKILLEIE